MFWLLVIGLAHAYLLWAGDILSIYAAMGFLLILFRRKTDDALLKWALVLLAVPILTYILFYILFVAFVPPEALAKLDAAQLEMWNTSVKTVPQSSYLQILTDYNLHYIVGRYASLIIEMRLPKLLAMFLLGCYAYRRGFARKVGMSYNMMGVRHRACPLSCCDFDFPGKASRILCEQRAGQRLRASGHSAILCALQSLKSEATAHA